MTDVKEIVDELEMSYKYSNVDENNTLVPQWIVLYIIDLLKQQKAVVIPHRNYQYLSDYWCECGWHLGKKGDVKFCPECGRKVNWDE